MLKIASAVSALALLPACASTTNLRSGVSVCDIYENPAAYVGAQVEIEGTWVTDYKSNAGLLSGECDHNGIRAWTNGVQAAGHAELEEVLFRMRPEWPNGIQVRVIGTINIHEGDRLSLQPSEIYVVDQANYPSEVRF